MVANVVAALRSAKHRGMIARRAGWSAVEPAAAPLIDAVLRAFTQRFPPEPVPSDAVTSTPAPRRIFCLWTGINAMSPNRVRAMDEIRRLNEPEVEVVLITPENLAEWVVAGRPLHPSYDDLALIHRSDYLRTYLMHHHGGGYTDVKAARHSWSALFDRLNGDPRAWLLGYREVSYRYVAPADPRRHRRLQLHHARLLGNGSYIVKPGTPFTAAWLAEAERRLDRWERPLAASPGEVYGGGPAYPLPFYGLLGEIFHPLCLDHHDRLLHDPRVTPQLTHYK